ncbi:Regulatory protein MsrR [Planococcus massiliensis]|uniref:Regulatory protein MsrR n=1 Tax=Planococcus massiliensis TaxID=1499687 RepID=A0A098EN58_9BACL|nr:LCP family protein [Planococcus massiliensis]CEG22731.1 Regulatory protein MsrR [Planococcus massiliensis]
MKRAKIRKIKRKKVSILLMGILAASLALACATAYSQFNPKKTVTSGPAAYINKESDETDEEIADFDMESINLLLIGSDRREEEYGLSDALMIVNYQPESKRVRLASIMRDAYVHIPEHGMQKINAAHAFGGPELVSETIEENFGIKTDYYAAVDFNGFPKLLDLIIPSGIEIDIPYEMSHGIGMTLEPGKQTLHGDQLLGYVRFRHDKNSDYGRVERQQEVLSAVKDQGVEFKTLLNLRKIIAAADTYIDTDIDKKSMLSLGKSLIQNGTADMETRRIPAADTFTEERKDIGEVLVLDLEANQNVLEDFFK